MSNDRVTLLNSIRKNFGEQSMFLMGSEEKLDVRVRSSGSLLLDIAMGGGSGQGRLTVIKGPERAGKTTILNMMIAEAQQREPDRECAIIDLEHSYNPEWAEKLGVNLDGLFFTQPDTYAERVFDLIEHLLETGKFSVIGLDSVAALITKEEMEQEDWDKESRVGGVSKLLSKAMRKLVSTGLLTKSGTSLVFINQIRDKIGGFSPYGTPTEMTGGRALRFYATHILDVAIGDMYSKGNGDSKVTLGQQIKVKVTKNKIAPPHKSAKIDVYYELGLDRFNELIEVAKLLNVFVGTSWITLVDPSTGEKITDSEGKEIKFQGKEKAKEALIEDYRNGGDLYAKVYELVQNTMRGGI